MLFAGCALEYIENIGGKKKPSGVWAPIFLLVSFPS